MTSNFRNLVKISKLCYQSVEILKIYFQEKVGGPAPPGAAISQNASSNGTYNYNSSSYPSSGQSGYQSGSGQQDYSAAWAQYYAQVSIF